VTATTAVVGGGGAPGVHLPSHAVSLPAATDPLLRAARVIGRLDHDRLLLDLRSIHPTDDENLRATVTKALTPPTPPPATPAPLTAAPAASALPGPATPAPATPAAAATAPPASPAPAAPASAIPPASASAPDALASATPDPAAPASATQAEPSGPDTSTEGR
ncbi:hypothetical protein AB0J52_38705, partial [Spirillospora sp. NPDC049652]